MKDKSKKTGARIFRVAIFVLVSGAIIWWFADQQEPIKINKRFKILGDKIFKPVKKQVKDTDEKLRRAEVVKETEKLIQEFVNQVDDFPKKQEKKIKKQIIQQVYDDLMEKYK